MNKKVIIIIILVVTFITTFIVINKTFKNKDSVNKTVSNETSGDKEKFTWKRGAPENYNVDKNVVINFNNSIKENEITSSLIIKDGVIINEYFKTGYDEKSIFPVHSCSKSITSILTGIAIDEGYIKDVNTKIEEYFDEVKDGDNDLQKQITIRHLLTHTSGFLSTDTDIWSTWRSSSNWLLFIFNSKMQNQPGERFRYSTGNTHVLSAILEKAIGENLYEFGKKNLFLKMDMDSIKCGLAPEGVTDGGNGYTLTAYDFAKFGLLYLQGGKWEGEQLVSKEWVDESTKTQVERRPLPSYGYQWWIRTVGDNNYHCYYAQGFGGQFLFVVPDLNLIITFTSNYNSDDYSNMFYKYVDDIVNATAS